MCNYCSLIASDRNRMNGMTEMGAPVIVTYAFLETARIGAELLSADARLVEAAREAIAHIETQAGVRFVEAPVSRSPMVEIAYNTDASGVSWAYLPSVTENSPNTTGEIGMSALFSSLKAGSVGYEILLHEFGHVLGLKHPFEDGRTLHSALDTTDNTVMSYTRTGAPKATLQELDVAALQALYGASEALHGVAATFHAATETLRIRGTDYGDVLVGANDGNRIRGQDGRDTLLGRSGDDQLRGMNGDDSLTAFGGNDRLFGGRGLDELMGGEGRDKLYGGRAHDALFGEGGDDMLLGGPGADTLFGGAGDDTLKGANGGDVMEGGPGADLFILTPAGHDVVTDFVPWEGDRLKVHALGIKPREAADHLTAIGSDFVLDAGHGQILLVGLADAMGWEAGAFV